METITQAESIPRTETAITMPGSNQRPGWRQREVRGAQQRTAPAYRHWGKAGTARAWPITAWWGHAAARKGHRCGSGKKAAARLEANRMLVRDISMRRTGARWVKTGVATGLSARRRPRCCTATQIGVSSSRLAQLPALRCGLMPADPSHFILGTPSLKLRISCCLQWT
jgi:hypothetical protein